MLWVVAADKGSPGVTTTALALAAASSEDDGPAALLVEADPGGGDLECWCGPLGAPGLLPAVTELRDRTSADRLADFSTPAVAGVDVVAAPTRAMPVGAALRAAGEGFAAALAAMAADVFVDCGRWLPSAPPVLEAVVAAAEGVVVVCRPTLAGVEHASSAIDALGRIPTQTVVVLVGGGRPYEPEEVAAALGVPVAGVLPLDPRGVTALLERGRSRALRRTGLGIAAADTAAKLRRLAVGDQVDSRG